jgi:predicted RNA binding protein YcfA (HicA-like mRNA interferase family)
MAKKEKLLDKARRNPQGLQFDEFETLLSLCRWEFKRQRGSHRYWYSPLRYRLSIQPTKEGKAKSYQVKQFLAQYDRENEPTSGL